jgi:hypothetical protein
MLHAGDLIRDNYGRRAIVLWQNSAPQPAPDI